jgi:hypothetical protein
MKVVPSATLIVRMRRVAGATVASRETHSGARAQHIGEEHAHG